VTDPVPDRPHMPGYGILPAGEGSGLIPWAEAERRLTVAHDYWLATVTPNGAPHVMPVCERTPCPPPLASSPRDPAGGRAADRRCTVTTDDARDPVVCEGVAERTTDPGAIATFVAAVNAKYDASVTVEFQDPGVNGTFAVRPVRAFALSGADFAGSPTRWRFADR